MCTFDHVCIRGNQFLLFKVITRSILGRQQIKESIKFMPIWSACKILTTTVCGGFLYFVFI